MEGIIIWIVIIVGWALLRGVFSGGSGKYQDEHGDEIDNLEILIIDLELFFGKWFGTSIYTISFMIILQFIYPLNRID